MTRRIGHELKCLNNLIVRNMQSFSSEDSPTYMQGVIIALIINDGDVKYQRDIEKRLSIRRSTATGILNNMEKNGLISRNPDRTDARLKKIELTDKAKLCYEQFKEDAGNMEKRMIEGISEEELNSFFATLDKIKANLNK